MKKYPIAILLCLLVLSLGVVGVIAQTSSSNVRGWSWSPNVGWMSFNSTDPNTGDNGVGNSATSYGVTVDSSGNMNGTIWSPNIGWISFDPAYLDDAPTCTSTERAHMSTSTGAVTGWVRALSGIGSAGYPDYANTGSGWDGCIQLSSGTNEGTLFPTGHRDGTKGVTYDNSVGRFKGYAWGGNNVGWISFNSTMTGWTQPNCENNCDGEGGSITAYCTSSSTPQGSSNLVTLTAYGQGGNSANYRYQWNLDTAPFETNSVKQISGVSSGSYAGQFSVRIADGTATSTRMLCNDNVVTDNPVTGNNIGLTIRRASGGLYTGTTTLVIAKGIPFALDWKLGSAETPNIFTDGDCTTSLTPISSAVTANWRTPDGWSDDRVNGLLPDGFTGSLPTTDSGIATGIYRFNLSCTHTDTEADPPSSVTKTGTATLRLTQSSIIEI
jgi:hypothetical protein